MLSTRGFAVAQLAVGAGLFAFSFTLDSKKARERAAAGETPGRLRRWRERAVGTERGSAPALAGLALTMGLAEVATMLPYLAAIGLVSTAGLGRPEAAGLLVAYCVVMVLPALVLTAGRVVASRLVERPLRRIDAWLTRNAASATAWIVGVVGFLVARDALGRLGMM
ncbi:Sap-like sulfolipid-1-addressing protein [Isoptericola variabilis J7]|nr:Sap-like sulfolipid-1-addressing protein [Isoptericola variabilis J7]